MSEFFERYFLSRGVKLTAEGTQVYELVSMVSFLYLLFLRGQPNWNLHEPNYVIATIRVNAPDFILPSLASPLE